MMRALLFLFIAGAVIYGFLVVTGDALSGGKSKDRVAIQSQPNHSADERLSSWDFYLPSRAHSQNPQSASAEQLAALSSQESEPNQNSRPYPMATLGDAAESPGTEGAKPASSINAPPRTQVAAELPPEALTRTPPVRKSSKRSRAAKRAPVVTSADPWSDRWARRADRRRGLFLFRPAPRFAAQLR